jgi:hypothetical protein
MPVISVDDPTNGIDTRPPDCSLQNIDADEERQIEMEESSSRSGENHRPRRAQGTRDSRSQRHRISAPAAV